MKPSSIRPGADLTRVSHLGWHAACSGGLRMDPQLLPALGWWLMAGLATGWLVSAYRSARPR